MTVRTNAEKYDMKSIANIRNHEMLIFWAPLIWATAIYANTPSWPWMLTISGSAHSTVSIIDESVARKKLLWKVLAVFDFKLAIQKIGFLSE